MRDSKLEMKAISYVYCGMRKIQCQKYFIALAMMLLHGLNAVCQSNSTRMNQQMMQNNVSVRDSLLVYLDSARAIAQTNPMSSLQLYNKVIEIAIRRKDVLHEAMAYMSEGNIRHGLGQQEIAISTYEKGLNALSRHEVPGNNAENNKQELKVQFDTRLHLAASLEKLKRYDEALRVLENLSASQFVFIEKSKRDELSRRIANIHSKNGKLNEAKTLLNKILEEERSDKRTFDEIETLLVLGEIAEQSGDSEAAIRYYQLSKKLSDSSGNNDQEIRSNNSLSSLYRTQQNFYQEIITRNDNIQLNQQSNNNSAIQMENMEIGNAYLNSNNLPKAEEYIQNSVNLLVQERNSIQDGASADTFSIHPLQYRSEKLQIGADAYKRLAEGFLKQNELQKAVEYFKEYSKMQDSADAERKLEMTVALELSAGFGRDQQRIELLEKERELSEKSMKVLQQDRDQKDEQVFNRNLIIGGLVFFVLLMVSAGILMVRNVKARRTADKLLALQSLSGQMNPHFIFNALNSVNEYISQNDERAANRYLSSFSKLMRQVMDDSRHTFISLQDELEMLRLYLILEHSRFKDKFEYELSISDQLKDSDYEIPPMLIQPYLENAIWHGLRYRQSSGYLVINFSVKNENLLIEITDDGIGIEKSKQLKTHNQKKQNSLAMRNIETRIQLLNEIYKSSIRIEIAEAFPGNEYPGTKVIMRIPQRNSILN